MSNFWDSLHPPHSSTKKEQVNIPPCGEILHKTMQMWRNTLQPCAKIAVLFGTQRQAITKHLKNIFESGELERQATCSILELVQKEELIFSKKVN